MITCKFLSNIVAYFNQYALQTFYFQIFYLGFRLDHFP